MVMLYLHSTAQHSTAQHNCALFNLYVYRKLCGLTMPSGLFIFQKRRKSEMGNLKDPNVAAFAANVSGMA